MCCMLSSDSPHSTRLLSTHENSSLTLTRLGPHLPYICRRGPIVRELPEAVRPVLLQRASSVPPSGRGGTGRLNRHLKQPAMVPTRCRILPDLARAEQAELSISRELALCPVALSPCRPPLAPPLALEWV